MTDFSNQELINEVALTLVEGVGSLTFKRLYDHYGNCEAILNAPERELLQIDGVGPKIAAQIAAAKHTNNAEDVLKYCQKHGIEIVSQRNVQYPELLKMIYDPPPILYVKGTLKEQDALGFAVVGTRYASYYGRKTAQKLTRGLAQYGFTIISGLAKGIDGVAHRAALEMGTRTFAVLGGGIGKIYPREHMQLADQIAENGALISEYHPLMDVNRGTFPQRNRIVVGMSIGVLVVEAPRRSGAIITARLAAENGRELFAVPGNIDSFASSGCNRLIRDGAVLVESVDDILDSLGPLFKPVQQSNAEETKVDELRHPGEMRLNEIEQQVLRQIAPTGTSLEQILSASELSSQQVAIALRILKKQNFIVQLGDSDQYARL